MREIMEKRRNIFFEGLSKIPFIKTTKPSGAFYIFFEIKELYGKITPQGKVLKTDIEVAEYFLEEGRVATVFGSAFGYSGFIRVSYATDEKILLEAAKRLDECIKKLK
jgi:aspartate aminotransferase